MLLCLALLPTLLFLGHWGIAFTLPIVDVHIVLVPESEQRDLVHPSSGPDEQDESASHSRHCHGGVATCSDVPYAGASGFALLSESVAMLASAPTAASIRELGELSALCDPGPDPRPPQALLSNLRTLAG